MLNQKKALLGAFDKAAELLDEEVQFASAILPKESLHITDRLNGIVKDIQDIAECIRQKGAIDEELANLTEVA